MIITRGDEFKALIKKIRSNEYDYDHREPAKTNWSKYDEAQIHEISDYLDNTRKLVDEANKRINKRNPPVKRGRGRPPVDPGDIAKVLLLQEFFGVSNRIAEGFLHLFAEKLGISRTFSYKTIERGYDREAVDQILNEVIKITNEAVRGKETTFSFDGTGFSNSTKVNYAQKRQAQNEKRKSAKTKATNRGKAKTKSKIKSKKPRSLPKKTVPDMPNNNDRELLPERFDVFPITNNRKHDFSYSLMGVGTRFKLISASSVCTDHSIGETTMFPEVFQQTLALHPDMQNALGDGIFAGRWIVQLVSENGVTPYFMPRANVTLRSKGFTGWKTMPDSLWNDPQDWLEQYHMRLISETVNSMIKIRFGDRITRRLEPRKRAQTFLKHVAHNVRRMGYLKILYDIQFSGAQGYG